MKPGGRSIPIDPPVYWLHVYTGWIWAEDRYHRGRVVMRRVRPRGPWPTIRLYRASEDPGTGGAVLRAPYWIRTAKP